MAGGLQFLKLGGSLITEKDQPHTARPEVIARLAGEIAAARMESPGLQLLLGHGSGSFGHIPALKYNTRQGVKSKQEWSGFVEVWREAAALNHIVMEALHDAGLPAVSFPPSASVLADDGRVAAWDIAPIRIALQAGLLPVVYGDVVFDTQRGGTILSTEDLFSYLALKFIPEQILLAGIEPGVWADYPACTQLLDEITARDLGDLEEALQGSAAADVTGGMASKVQESVQIARQLPMAEVRIFSAVRPRSLLEILRGAPAGTRIRG